MYTTELEFQQFRDFIEDHCGIFLEKEKKYLIETRLSNLIVESECKSFGEFYIKLKKSSLFGQLLEKVVDALTTNETLWFRDEKPYQILEEIIFPEFQQKIESGKREKIDIWSAACSAGQEPYSIAIKALDFLPSISEEETNPISSFTNHINILATDISSSILHSAKQGKYNATAIKRGLPNEILEQYFCKNQNSWYINPEVKNMINFKQLNLKVPFSGLVGHFDIIFLRNVIIYFSDAFKKILFERIIRVLNPRGYLFLGAGESAGGYTEAFEPLRFNDFIYYRLKT